MSATPAYCERISMRESMYEASGAGPSGCLANHSTFGETSAFRRTCCAILRASSSASAGVPDEHHRRDTRISMAGIIISATLPSAEVPTNPSEREARVGRLAASMDGHVPHCMRVFVEPRPERQPHPACSACLVVMGALLACMATLAFEGDRSAPRNSERTLARDESRPLVLAVGDSLTMGMYSYDWVHDAQIARPGLRFVNLGRNGHHARNALADVRALQLPRAPALAVVLVGTNDALGTLSDGWVKMYQDMRKLPRELSAADRPSPSSYARNLAELLRVLRKQHGAKKVVVVTPPPLSNGQSARGPPPVEHCFGGQLARHPNGAVQRMAARARRVARRARARLVDLHRTLGRDIRLERRRRAAGAGEAEPMFNTTCSQLLRQQLCAAATRFVPGVTQDHLGTPTPTALFSHDHIHLNGHGARRLLALLEPVLDAVERRTSRHHHH